MIPTFFCDLDDGTNLEVNSASVVPRLFASIIHTNPIASHFLIG